MSLYFERRKVLNTNTFSLIGYMREEPWGRVVIEGQLSALPGSPSIWVSHDLSTVVKYRRQGYSLEYNRYMKHVAFQELKATAVIASVKQDNDAQHKRLIKLGWEKISNALWILRRN